MNHRTESVVSHDTYPALTVTAPTLQPNHGSDCVIETYRVRRTRGGVTQRTRISKVVLFDILHDEKGDGLLAKYVSFEKWQESVARDLDVEQEELSKTCVLYILMKDGAWDLVRWNSHPISGPPSGVAFHVIVTSPSKLRFEMQNSNVIGDQV